MPPIQQISFLLAGFLLIAYSGYEAWTMKRGRRRNRMLIWAVLVVLGIGVFVLFLEPRDSDNFQNLESAEALIGNGTPTMLEVYSEY